MKILESLSKTSIASILGIVVVVFSSLWIYEHVHRGLEETKNIEYVNKLEEENQALIYEIENLQEQNKILMKVLELKQNLE
jgi:hypothetical protein